MFSFCLHQLDCIPSCSDPTTSEDTRHIVLVYTAMHPKLRGAPRTAIRTYIRHASRCEAKPFSKEFAHCRWIRASASITIRMRFSFSLNDRPICTNDCVDIGVRCPAQCDHAAHESCTIQATTDLYNSSLVIDRSLCNGLRFLSCVSMSVLRAMTSNLPLVFDPTPPTCSAPPRFLGGMSHAVGVGWARISA